MSVNAVYPRYFGIAESQASSIPNIGGTEQQLAKSTHSDDCMDGFALAQETDVFVRHGVPLPACLEKYYDPPTEMVVPPCNPDNPPDETKINEINVQTIDAGKTEDNISEPNSTVCYAFCIPSTFLSTAAVWP